MAKTSTFLAFIIISSILLALNSRSRFSVIPRVNISPKTVELSYFWTSVWIYASVSILTGFTNPWIAGSFLVAAQVDVLGRVVFGQAALGRAPRRHMAETFWITECYFICHAAWIIATYVLSVLVMLGYLISVIVIYFTGSPHSTASIVAILRITLMAVFLGRTVVSLPYQIGVAASRNLSSATRWRFTVSSVTSLLPAGTLLATFLWTFSSPNFKTVLSVLNFRTIHLPLVLAVLSTYVIGTFFAPYAIGTARNSQWLRTLLRARFEILGAMRRVLLTPVGGSYDRELLNLSGRLEEDRTSFIASDDGISLGVHLDKRRKQEDDLPAGTVDHKSSDVKKPTKVGIFSILSEAVVAENLFDVLVKIYLPVNYYLARQRDPRFQHLDWMDSLMGRLAMTRADLAVKENDDKRVQAARAWADSYDDDRRNMTESATMPNTTAAVLTSTALATVASAFFAGFGSWLWSHVVETLPK